MPTEPLAVGIPHGTKPQLHLGTLGERRHSIESPCVALLPDGTADEEEEGVKTTSPQPWQRVPATQSPLDRRCDLDKDVMLKVQLPHLVVPNLTTENATNMMHLFESCNP